jgi:hypothetical protein
MYGALVDTLASNSIPLQFGRTDLLTFMKKYWVSQDTLDSSFWAHECTYHRLRLHSTPHFSLAVSKHGTCFSTFDTQCYSPYTQHEDVVNFFDTVTKAYLMVRSTFVHLINSNFWSSFRRINGLRRLTSLLQTPPRTTSVTFRTRSSRPVEQSLISAARMVRCPRCGTSTM